MTTEDFDINKAPQGPLTLKGPRIFDETDPLIRDKAVELAATVAGMAISALFAATFSFADRFQSFRDSYSRPSEPFQDGYIDNQI